MQIAHGDLPFYKFRWPVLAYTMRGGYYDRDAERNVIDQIREHGCIVNADAYGFGWNEGHGDYCETAWIDKRWKADSPFALERERKLAKELAEKRKRQAEEMKAAREHVQAEWQREKDQAKKLKAYEAIQAKERRKRWEQENQYWLNKEKWAAERKAARQKANQEAHRQEAHREAQAVARRRRIDEEQRQVVYEYIGEPPANCDWRVVTYYRRDYGLYTWDTLKIACRIAIVDQKQELLTQIIAFLNLPNNYWNGVLAACDELVSEGKLERYR
jgi:hypothetical protein